MLTRRLVTQPRVYLLPIDCIFSETRSQDVKYAKGACPWSSSPAEAGEFDEYSKFALAASIYNHNTHYV